VTLVVGMDVGATRSRAVLCDATGAVLGRGEGPGGNPNSSAGDPAENIGTALRAALGDHDPSAVAAGTIGIAGIAARSAQARTIADAAWRSAALPGSPGLATDLDIAYAAGATGGDGVLLLSGTGAIAGAFHEYVMVRRCDGLGWIFGDEGSAVWFGLTAVRAALAALDGRGPATVLTELLADRMVPAEPTDDPRQNLIGVGYQWPPARFGELAPLVVTAADSGDEVADRILTDGCAALARTVLTIADDLPHLVLAGSLLTTPGPIATRVRTALAPHFPSPPTTAPDPVAGAVLTALRTANLPVPPELPARLAAGPRAGSLGQ
jgi:N-acetylglucosamine kinase-like BadF-type ATPase